MTSSVHPKMTLLRPKTKLDVHKMSCCVGHHRYWYDIACFNGLTAFAIHKTACRYFFAKHTLNFRRFKLQWMHEFRQSRADYLVFSSKFLYNLDNSNSCMHIKCHSSKDLLFIRHFRASYWLNVKRNGIEDHWMP